jgi:hypothetical protein
MAENGLLCIKQHSPPGIENFSTRVVGVLSLEVVK